jgi:hydroxyacylglutathione hydrolase
MAMWFRQVFDDKLAQYAYLIGCQQTGEALVIDPQRDVDRTLDIAAAEGLRIVAATETHIHADFLSGTRELAARDPRIAVYLSAEGGEEWRYRWPEEGACRVHWLRDGETFSIGKIEIQAVHTPGHTPEHLSFLVTDRGGGADAPMGMATGDFVFVGDLGRPDLLESAAGVVGAREPAARQLYDSARHFLELPDHLQVWPGHGAGSACGKALGAVPSSTVGYERRYSGALSAAQGEQDGFVAAILEGQPEPPLYFARMKHLNRDGAPILGALPDPPRLDAEALASLAGSRECTVIDTRLDRQSFLDGHLPGSLFAPLNRVFPTVVGSYADPALPVYLIVEPEQVEEAVRALVRIGYDRIAGFAPPALLTGLPRLQRIAQTDFETVKTTTVDSPWLDVRGATEVAEGKVPGALHVPYTRLGAHLDELPRGAPLQIYCATGNRAVYAAAFLERQGFQVAAVTDSFARWQEEGRVAVG